MEVGYRQSATVKPRVVVEPKGHFLHLLDTEAEQRVEHWLLATSITSIRMLPIYGDTTKHFVVLRTAEGHEVCLQRFLLEEASDIVERILHAIDTSREWFRDKR